MSQSEWEEMAGALPGLLDQLLASPVYGRGPGREPPPRGYGVYLFSESGRPMYVGRCGLTERARRRGGGFSDFRARLANHTQPWSRHTQATFAWRIACEQAEAAGLETLGQGRAARQRDPEFEALFTAAKERVGAMGFQVVEINDERLAYLFEFYTALRLGTPYNSFAVS